MDKWAIVIGIYTFVVFVAGALFGRWLWMRLTAPSAEDRWREADKRAIAAAVSVTQRFEP